jgi:RNA polymerase sigma-70 factor (ECF subfamily)
MSEFPETRTTLIAHVRSPEDREAWQEFVSVYRPVIYRMARNRGMQDADAQDLSQDVLVRVANAIHRWEKSSPEIRFRNWLAKVTKNAIFSALTRTPVDVGAGGTDIQDLLNSCPDANSAIAAELALEFRREQYHRAAAIVRSDVSIESWRAFELSIVEGMPCEEVAEQIGKSLGAVYAARSRVVRRLRIEIERLEN